VIQAASAGSLSNEATYRANASFPSVNLGLTAVRGSSTAPTLNSETGDIFLDVGDTIDTSGQRRFGSAGAKATWSAALAQLEETKLTLAQQIRDGYWTLALAREQLRLANETLDEVKHVNQLTRTQQEVGAAPQIDVLRSDIDVANADQALLTAEASERTALAAFNTLLNQPPMAPVNLGVLVDTRTATGVTAAAPPTLESLTSRALERRPLIQAAREQIRAMSYAVKQANASRLPDVSLDYERSVQDPSQAAVLGVHLPLLDLGVIRQTIKSAEESRRQAEFQRRSSEEQVRQQVAQAFSDYVQAQAAAQRYAAQIVAPSETLLGKAQIGYQEGATGILPVLDAESTLRNARNGYVSALLALFKAQDELQAATGDSVVQVSIATTPPAG